MKRFMRSFFYLALLSSGAILNADDCCTTGDGNLSSVASPVRSIILPRNQGSNTARELVGWQDFIHLCLCETYGSLAVAFEYQRSFRPARIAAQLFGARPGDTASNSSLCCDSSDENFLLNFQGSNVANRDANSLLADYFGLSQDFNGALILKPVIDNFIVDFEFFLGLDCWVPGLFFRAHLPITHTRWSLFDTNGNCTPGSSNDAIERIGTGSLNTPFPICYMDDTQVTPATSIMQALSGNFLFGDMQTEWRYGKFSRKRLDKTRLADIDLILGYDFLCNECHHFGLFIQAVCPTGNSPESINIFEPIAGTAGHWGLGAGLTAHATLWENDCDQNLSFWVEGNVHHLFKDTQKRSFDFKTQGPLSRYMLLKEFDSNGVYTGRLINAINFTTRDVRTSFKVTGDASAKFAYRNCGFMADIGYNIWGRSCEKVDVCNNLTGTTANDLADNRFGFKGCEGVCARNFVAQEDGVVPPGMFRGDAADPASTALNSTASNATAYSCGTIDNGQFITTSPVEAGDTISLAWNGTPATATSVVTLAPNNIPANVVDGVIFAQQSVPPVLLTRDSINFLGATSALTHKIFGYVGYTWFDCDFTPFIGILGEVEFDGRRGNKNNDCNTLTGTSTSTITNTSTNCHDDRSINQWGIGVKGGISF